MSKIPKQTIVDTSQDPGLQYLTQQQLGTTGVVKTENGIVKTTYVPINQVVYNFVNNQTPGAAGGTQGGIQINEDGGLTSDSDLTYDTGTDTLNVSTLVVARESDLGAIGNVHISGGESGQVISTDGAGHLTWSTIPGGLNGNPFDQDLNTTNSPTFTGLSLNNGGISAFNGLDFYTGNNGSLDLYTDWESGQGTEVYLQHGVGVSITTTSGTHQWKFDNSGVLHLPNYVNKNTADTVSCPANMDTVIYTVTDQFAHTIKLLLKIEGQENSLGQWETQSCEMMVAKSFNGNKVAGSVYGLVYTSQAPLATFSTRWNSSINRVEVLCRPSANDSVWVRSFATEIITSD